MCTPSSIFAATAERRMKSLSWKEKRINYLIILFPNALLGCWANQNNQKCIHVKRFFANLSRFVPKFSFGAIFSIYFFVNFAVIWPFDHGWHWDARPVPCSTSQPDSMSFAAAAVCSTCPSTCPSAVVRNCRTERLQRVMLKPCGN